MNVKLKKLSDQVIVITGASSGIGLVTARMAAKGGARLILNARNEATLQRVCARYRRTTVRWSPSGLSRAEATGCRSSPAD